MQLKEGSNLQSGKYRIIRVLGQGGFGITYLAENVLLGRMVAIKEFFPRELCGRDNTSHLTLGTQNNAETVAWLRGRFLKEARNIARLDHPGIIRIHDVFEENNTAYYVMDYIEGESLSLMVKQRGPLPEATAVGYIRKVGDALDYIHSRNMTHFDVKPANIMVRSADNTPILIDFGLSKQYDASGDATTTFKAAASHGFSPIELYNNGELNTFSPQTDVYSLGATLYYLLTGIVPPAATAVLEDGIEIPSTVSAPVRTALEAAMEPIRKKRPTQITTFCEMLTASPASEALKAPKTKKVETPISEETKIFSSEPQEIPKPKPEPQPKPQPRPKPAPSPVQPEEISAFDESIESNKSRNIILGVIIFIICVIIGAMVKCANDQQNYYSANSSANNNSNYEIIEVVEEIPATEIDTTSYSTPRYVDGMYYQSAVGRCSYYGTVDSNGHPHGKGAAYFQTGDATDMSGTWEHGNIIYTDKYRLKNGDTFEGRWYNNKYLYGRYTVKSTGAYFNGDFQNGTPVKGTWYDKYHNIISRI